MNVNMQTPHAISHRQPIASFPPSPLEYSRCPTWTAYSRRTVLPGDDDLSIANISKLYSDAVFCLQPMGDAISRKGVIDAVLLGCIPVSTRLASSMFCQL